MDNRQFTTQGHLDHAFLLVKLRAPRIGASMKATGFLLAGVLLLAMPAIAQDSSSQDTGSVVAAAKASREQLKLKQVKEDDIRRLLQITGAGALAGQTMDEMEKSMRPLIANALPPGDYRDQLVELFFQKFREKRDPEKLAELIVPVYEKYYSDEEVNALIQFYQTPLGQKMLTVLPKVAAESQAAGAQWGQQLGRETMMEVLAEHPDLQKALETASKAQPAH